MSLAGEFVKRMAAVKCDHQSHIGEFGGTVGYVAGIESDEDRRKANAANIAAQEARCPFCIARAVMGEAAFPETGNIVPPCKICGSTAYGTHFGHGPDA